MVASEPGHPKTHAFSNTQHHTLLPSVGISHVWKMRLLMIKVAGCTPIEYTLPVLALRLSICQPVHRHLSVRTPGLKNQAHPSQFTSHRMRTSRKAYSQPAPPHLFFPPLPSLRERRQRIKSLLFGFGEFGWKRMRASRNTRMDARRLSNEQPSEPLPRGE